MVDKNLVERLLPLLEKQDEGLRRTLTRDLFETNDRINESAVIAPLRCKLVDTTEAAKVKLSTNLVSWTISTTQVLSDFAEDIKLIHKAVARNAWDKDVLREVIQLVGFLRYRFLNEENIYPLIAKCRETPEEEVRSPKGPRETYGGLADTLEKSQGEVDDALRIWVASFQGRNKQKEIWQQLTGEGGGDNVVDSKISTATLRELLIRNELLQWRSKIVEELRNNNLSSKKGGIEYMTAPVTKRLADLGAGASLTHGPKKIKDRHAWRSRTIAIILDTRNRIVLTGGTKFTCHESDLFAEAIRAISKSRIGGEDSSFKETVRICNQDFNSIIKNIVHKYEQKPSTFLSANSEADKEEINRVHDGILKADKTCNKLPTSDEQPILSWAYNGYSFQPKPPCLRCQWMFTSWVMHKTPSSTEERCKDLTFWLRLVSSPKNAAWLASSEIFYCAETVAAVKVNLLRKGKLALVV